MNYREAVQYTVLSEPDEHMYVRYLGAKTNCEVFDDLKQSLKQRDICPHPSMFIYYPTGCK